MPSSSMMSASTSRQNSSRVCQSRPLRASRDASMHNTAPTLPSQSTARSLSKPGRCTPPPERPRSSSMTVTSCHPSVRARSTKEYWRRWLSRLCWTWSRVDWRTYTTACRLRCSLLILLIGPISVFSAHGVEQQFDEQLQYLCLDLFGQRWGFLVQQVPLPESCFVDHRGCLQLDVPETIRQRPRGAEAR